MRSLCTEPLLTNEQNHLLILLAKYLHPKLTKQTMINYISCSHIFLSAVAHENFLVIFNEGLRQSETKGIPVSLIVFGQSVGYFQG